MNESTSGAKPDPLKSMRNLWRGAKAKATRIGNAMKSLLDETRPIEEVKEVYEKYILAYDELQDKHDKFTELIDDDDEFEKEAQWLEECQQSFLRHQISFRDYCKTAEMERDVVSQEPMTDSIQNDEASPSREEVHTQNPHGQRTNRRVESIYRMEKPKMPIFNGNVREYCIFKADFQHALGEAYDDRDALMILRSCLQGKPLQMIQGIGRDYTAAWA